LEAELETGETMSTDTRNLEFISKKGKPIQFLGHKVLEEGAEFVGVFIESYINPESRYKSTNHKFKALGDQTLGDIKVLDGDMVVFNGTGSLNKLMGEIIQREVVKVVYEGQSIIKTGQYKGSNAYNYDVLSSGEMVSEEEIAEYLYEEVN
jgi:hypothetical protein